MSTDKGPELVKFYVPIGCKCIGCRRRIKKHIENNVEGIIFILCTNSRSKNTYVLFYLFLQELPK